ncbi:MAG: hypothetical protein H6617_09300 [Bdellovibrionaceae bacterium]|nr:hypothetical protein [Bdellovibrionales bacterium]MCB9254864.1 hypothetical protein [Pseudobdellovibrionaceae bacterium]
MPDKKSLTWGSYAYYVLSAVMLLGTVYVLIGCVTANAAGKRSKKAPDMQLHAGQNELIVAAYNVLNLFDTQYDEGKEDYTFLPSGTEIPGTGKKKEDFCGTMTGYYKQQCLETNWTEAHFQHKLKQIKKAVGAIGDLPDLLGIEEIENENAARELASVLGYGTNYYITNSPDHRGIDVALLYRGDKLELLGEPYEIKLTGENFPPSFNEKPTRNILRMQFKPKGNADIVLSVYVNHWPSQAATAKTLKRMLTAEALKKDIDAETKRIGKEKHYVIALGDFNTLLREVPNAFNNVIQDPKWENAMVDAQDLAIEADQRFMRRMPPGTYFYYGDRTWNKLDRLLFSANFNDRKGIELQPKSFRIVAPDFLMAKEPFAVNDPEAFLNGSVFSKIPVGYNFLSLEEDTAGYSDHLPVAVKVTLAER